MNTWKSFKQRLLKDKEFAAEYKRLQPRYDIISQLIEARIRKGITQQELAKKMGTKQSAIARLESGNYNPTLEFLIKTAKALDSRINININ